MCIDKISLPIDKIKPLQICFKTRRRISRRKPRWEQLTFMITWATVGAFYFRIRKISRRFARPSWAKPAA